MRLGVLDVGSNTVHLLVVDAHRGGHPTPMSSTKAPLRLAEAIDDSGKLTRRGADRLVETVDEFAKIATSSGCADLMAFATSAVRDARNGDEVLARVLAETGLTIDVLSGEDEARMTFLAVRRWFGWSSGRLLVVDIGGGSLELATGSDEAPDDAVSLPLGAGRVTRAFLDGDPPSSDALRELRRHARAEIASVAGRLRRHGEPRIAAATSKTLKQLARAAGAAPSDAGPHVPRTLALADVTDLIARMSGMSAAERALLPGVSEGRAGQLLGGAIVAEAAMDLLEVPELAVCPWALREGVLLDRLDRLPR